MSDQEPKEVFRNDELVRKAGEQVLDSFKYLAACCWAPVVLVLAFFRAGDAEFGTFVRIILSGSIVSLMIAGAIFFLAYQRQQMMIIHALMGEEAISRAIEVNPLNAWIIEQNTRLAQQLGHWADRVAFPLMTISYVVLSLSAGFAVWL